MKYIDRWAVHQKNRAYYKKKPFSDTVVIFIHGILEGSMQFRNLGAIAYKEGYSISLLLLPGHGETGEAFAEVNLKEWIDYVNKHIYQMQQQYKHIILVGHSMGSLLAIGYAAHFPGKIEALVLLALPLAIELKPRVIKGAIKIATGKIPKKEPYVIAECKAISVGKTKGCTYIKWIPRYIELFILIAYTRKQLKKIKKPVLIIQSKKDEFVSLKAIGVIQSELSNSKTLLLEDSGHFCYHSSDIMKLELAFKRFLQEKNE